MRTLTILFLLLLLVVAGCARFGPEAPSNRVSLAGSGHLVSREEPISGFDEVAATSAFAVTIRQAETHSVVVSVDDNLAPYLQVERVGSTLALGLKPGYAYDIHAATMRVDVSMPALAEVHLDGASRATLVDFQFPQMLSADLSGAAALEGTIEAPVLDLDLNGSASVTLSGAGEQVRVDACGSSVVDLHDYRAQEATVVASCASTVILDAARQLAGQASGNARIYYLGAPSLEVDLARQTAAVAQK